MLANSRHSKSQVEPEGGESLSLSEIGELSSGQDTSNSLPNGDSAMSSEQSATHTTKKKKKKARQTSASNRDCPVVSPNPNTSLEPVTGISSLDDELEWCIAQLELGMLRPGASKTQKQQNQKNIQSLRGSKTPLPKKRQLMRSLFGDYRSKMKSQPLPENFVTKEAVKVEPAKPELIETVGTYYRKSVVKPSTVCNGSDCSFKFNFSID